MIFLLVPAALILGRCLFEGGIYSNNYGNEGLKKGDVKLILQLMDVYGFLSIGDGTTGKPAM